MTVIDQAILGALEKQRFSSIRELAQLTCITAAPVHWHLTQSLGFVVKHLRWVPHRLTDTQKDERITLSNQSLRQLRSIKHHGWHFIITLDESWFYLAIDHAQIWLCPEENPHERHKHTIQNPKLMPMIAWNLL
jgi:hypothetical protein